MSKPVTPQDMFDLWQKMVNPGAYPLQSLMFPVLDSKELERKIAELEVVEHWLKANVNMVALTIKSLQFQRDMVKGGEKVMKDAGKDSGEVPNPAMWAWNMMADAAKSMPQAPEPPQSAKKRSRKRQGKP
jgi:hypothetical protein